MTNTTEEEWNDPFFTKEEWEQMQNVNPFDEDLYPICSDKEWDNNIELNQRPSKADFVAEKRRILAEAEAQNLENKNRLDKWVEENTPKKGVVTKKIWNLPIPSHKNIMRSDLDYQFLGAVLLNSNFGGKANNMSGERFIYKNKLWALDDEENVPKIAKELKISLSTFKRRIKALLNVKLGIVEIANNEDGETFYKLKYATDNKYYITINNEMLEELVTSTNSNIIKLYSLMYYNLTEHIKAEDGSYSGYKNIRKQMTYDYMLENIGYSTKLNRNKVKTMLNSLRKLGFIKIYEIDTPIRKIDKATNTEIILTVKGFEYELCTYDEWLEIDTIGKK